MRRTCFIAILCLLCLVLSGCQTPHQSVHTPVTTTTVATTAATTTTTTTTTTTAATIATTTTTRPSSPPTNAKAAVLQRLNDGEILFSMNAQKTLYPASTTKLLTALLVLQFDDLNRAVTVTQGALDKVMYDASRCSLKAGMTLTLRQLLEGMLLTSGCDASYVLAETVGRTLLNDPSADIDAAVSAFVQQMNRTAQALGATHSRFVNPDGYHHPDHITTAADLLLIAKAAYNEPVIREIVKQEQVTETIDGRTLTWENTNFLLRPESEWYCPQVVGMKTGFTDEAGYCVIVAVEQAEDVYLLAVMGSPSNEERWHTVHQFLDAYDIG